jgi:plastocyanin
MKRYTIASVFLVLAMLLTSCSLHGLIPGGATPAPTKQKHAKAERTPGPAVQISITSTAFDPQTLNIKTGDTVIWTNNDTVAHTIVTDNQALNSGAIAPVATFTFVFKRVGTYSYHLT